MWNSRPSSQTRTLPRPIRWPGYPVRQKPLWHFAAPHQSYHRPGEKLSDPPQTMGGVPTHRRGQAPAVRSMPVTLYGRGMPWTVDVHICPKKIGQLLIPRVFRTVDSGPHADRSFLIVGSILTSPASRAHTADHACSGPCWPKNITGGTTDARSLSSVLMGGHRMRGAVDDLRCS